MGNHIKVYTEGGGIVPCTVPDVFINLGKHSEEHSKIGIRGKPYKANCPIPVFGGSSMDLSQIAIVSGSPAVTIEIDEQGTHRLKVVTGAGVTAQLNILTMNGAYFGGDIYVKFKGSYEDGLQSFSYYTSPGATIATNYVLSGALNFSSATKDSYLQPGAGNTPAVWRTGRINNAVTGTITYPFIVGSNKLEIKPRPGFVATVYIYLIGIGHTNQKGRCFIMADDNDMSWITRGAPFFNEVGIPTTTSLMASSVGLSSIYATLDQLKGYVGAGNSIIAHGPTGGSYDGNLISVYPDNINRIADMNSCRDFIFDNKLQTENCEYCYVWPQGVYQSSIGDTSLLDMAIANGFTTARCSALINPLVQYNMDAVTKHQRLALPNTTHGWGGSTAGQVALITAINNAINSAALYGTDIFITFHHIVLDSTIDAEMNTTKCRVSDMLSIRNTVRDAVAAGTLDCLTLPECVPVHYNNPWYTF